MKRIVYTKIGGPDSIEIISEKLEQAVDNEVKVRCIELESILQI